MNLKNKLRAFGAFVMAAPAVSFAALPTGVATSITAAQTDGLEAVGLLAAMGAAIYLIKKVLSKLGII